MLMVNDWFHQSSEDRLARLKTTKDSMRALCANSILFNGVGRVECHPDGTFGCDSDMTMSAPGMSMSMSATDMSMSAPMTGECVFTSQYKQISDSTPSCARIYPLLHLHSRPLLKHFSRSLHVRTSERQQLVLDQRHQRRRGAAAVFFNRCPHPLDHICGWGLRQTAAGEGELIFGMLCAAVGNFRTLLTACHANVMLGLRDGHRPALWSARQASRLQC